MFLPERKSTSAQKSSVVGQTKELLLLLVAARLGVLLDNKYLTLLIYILPNVLFALKISLRASCMKSPCSLKSSLGTQALKDVGIIIQAKTMTANTSGLYF